MGLLIKGLVVGFVVAAPAGPIAVMCLHRSIEEGHLSGIATGIGAALGDTVFGALALFGVGYVAAFISSEQIPLRLGGGVVLCALGIVTFLRRPRPGTFVEDHITLIGAFAGAFALTLANPITILAFLAIFSAIGVEHLAGQRVDAVTLIAGILAGSTAWWMLLAVGAALFRDRFTEKGLIWITRISGLVIVGFGVAALVSGIGRLISGTA
jgi:threonine/homoserine/homoserine lactone efflux protein